MPNTMAGVLAPVVTPYTETYEVHVDRLIEHCRWLLEKDCGLAIFGTNSEGTSLSVGERIDIIDRLVDEGLPADRMMPGGGTPSLPDTVRLCQHIAAKGCGGSLVLPPYYYKDATDDGLFAYFDALIDKVGDDRLRLYLYHIPPVAGIGYSMALYERLIKAFPNIVVGTKDSSRDNDHTQALIDNFPGFAVFPGNESALARFMKSGGVGTISATCNVNPGAIVALYKNFDADDAAAQQERLNEVRGALAKYPMIAAMKATIAKARGEPAWRTMRPPLMALSDTDAEALARDLEAIDFSLDV